MEWSVSQANPTSTTKKLSTKQKFDYLHKKQTGGQGQYARVIGYIEPLSEERANELGQSNPFENMLVGQNIPPEYYSSCEKGTHDAMVEGAPLELKSKEFELSCRMELHMR